MSLTKVSYSMVKGAPANVLDYGADPTGTTDNTAAIQAALDSNAGSVYLPEGTYLFSTLTVNKNTRLHGASTRTSILKHTGTATAIQCVYSGSEQDERGTYISEGWFIFEDFELMANGTVGFNVGKTHSCFTMFNRLYIRHRRDLVSGNPNKQYFPGSVAINCNNSPDVATYPTFFSKVHHCFIRGFETGIVFSTTVNAWEISRLWAIECLRQIVIDNATGISVIDSYFETGVVGATGILFLGGGGNQINVVGSTFELTNASATQYAYVFAGGNWTQITAVGCKYLIEGDGNAVNSKRVYNAGATVLGFTELNRTYTSANYGEIPMLWSPYSTASKPFQMPNYSRVGGFQQGNGAILFGRNDSDAVDAGIYFGYDSPEGVVTANTGSLYLNSAGGANVTLYVKESGSGNTGWVAK